MKVYKSNEKIHFLDKEQNILGFTDYSNELWDKVLSVNWKVIWGKPNAKGKRKGYIGTYSKKLGDYKKLHQIVMIHWYGFEALKEAYEKNFIVEHMNNNPYDCMINNLSFAPNRLNIAKGQTYDIDRKEIMSVAAINMFKDFETKRYQITVGFNKEFAMKLEKGLVPLNALRFVYENNFRRTFMDAENILYGIMDYGMVDTNKLHHIHMDIEQANYIHLKEHQKKAPFVEIDGSLFQVRKPCLIK